jgi:glycosyltransferase involved in cell wall biosynthesis
VTTTSPPRVAVLAPNLDAGDVGETATAYRLLRAMADTGSVELVILGLQRAGRVPAIEQLPDVRVVTWPEPPILLRMERFNATVKPAIPWFYALARAWIRDAQAAGLRFDLLHQMLPRAPRYASPLHGLGVPYVIGPVGGAIPMPGAFRDGGRERWYTHLRELDKLRFAFDPWLRRGFAEADLVLGVAPYMLEVLAELPIRRFEPFLGIGVDELGSPVTRQQVPGRLRLLHVGRAVRTKGVREAVRALGHLPDLPGVTLTVVGDGEELNVVRGIAADLELGTRVAFLGKRPRHEIENLYRSHDVLLFPSFRESMGAVLYEAMRWGMPVITVDHGGPGFIVDERCGLKVPLTTPEKLPRDLAEAVRKLAVDLEVRATLGVGARQKVQTDALWRAKAQRMLALYASVLGPGRFGTA